MAGGGISGGWEPPETGKMTGRGHRAVTALRKKRGGRGSSREGGLAGALASLRPSDEVSGSAVGGDDGRTGGNTMEDRTLTTTRGTGEDVGLTVKCLHKSQSISNGPKFE